MNEAEVIRQMREHVEGLFPKYCSNCGRRFDTLRKYLLATTHLGSAMPYDADLGDWKPENPLGAFLYSNCPCGNTLALSSKGMPLPLLWSIMAWAKRETKKQKMTPQELLTHLRDEMCKQVLSEQNQKETTNGKDLV